MSETGDGKSSGEPRPRRAGGQPKGGSEVEAREPREQVNILLVDDQVSRLLSYEVILDNLGQNLVRAQSGIEALDRLMKDEYAVVLLDVSMPGMDGFETAALIHQHPRFEQTPIIFVTAHNVTDLDRLKGYELGAVDYVYVPVVPEILRSKVAVLVELHLKRRELQRVNRTLAQANAELAAANSTLQAEKARELERLNAVLARANADLAQTNRSLHEEMAERTLAQDKLRDSEERLRRIVENTPALIYQMDSEHRFVHVNRRFEDLFRRRTDEIRGLTTYDVFPNDVAEQFIANNRRVLEEARTLECEEAVPLPDGVHTYASVKAPLLDDAGRVYGVVGVSTDITERKHFEEVLREGDRRKDEFLAMLAHELRNPLAPIINAVQLMRLNANDDPELTWCRDVIERQTDHLRRLVEDLLDVSRITQGKIKLQKERVEIGAVVTRAIEITRPLIDARRHELVVDLPADRIEIEGDMTRLAQVVGNLLNNAAKYTDEGGTIRVAAALAHGEGGRPEVVVRVRDSGVGIPPEMLPVVFELFTQVERTLDRAQGGLGIGLALVRRLVEMHGGTVSASSEGSQRGSEFVVRLPVLDGKPQTATADAVPTDAKTSAGRRVLVVDDNVDSARSLAMLLESRGNAVLTAHDGVEAIETAEKFRPDIVLLDIGMPKMDGYSAARWIRAQSWGRSVVLVAVTGWGQEEVRGRTHEAGFDAHLVKPVEFGSLAKLLANLPGDAAACLVA